MLLDLRLNPELWRYCPHSLDRKLRKKIIAVDTGLEPVRAFTRRISNALPYQFGAIHQISIDNLPFFCFFDKNWYNIVQ